MDSQNQPSNSKNNFKLSFDFRVVTVILLVVIAVMLFIWKPWDSGISDRTIEVTGESTVTATPDEFIFYPTYQFENADKTAALAELSKKSDEIVAELKKLGVKDEDIKTNSSGYDYSYMPTESKDATYTLQLTVTVDDQELAQKVQDYLVTTSPTGSVSPQPTFSDAKRKELEAQARDQATKDARAKADQSAENLGFKVGKVKSVSDSTASWVIPYGSRATTTDLVAPEASMTIQPGENDLPYSVTVVYYIR
jgi:uncharacterized protein YggE